jgi:hypothetical protein
VPADAEQAFFLDLKPDGETGRHWQRIRAQLEANPTGQEVLHGLLQEFMVEEYGLEELVPGPVVSGYWNGVDYAIALVEDEVGVAAALRQHYEGMEWEQEEFEGKTLYHGRHVGSYQWSEYRAWTVHNGLLFLTSRFSSVGPDNAALIRLRALLGLNEENNLANLTSWQTLLGRLPEDPMGVIFVNTAEQARRRPPPPSDASLSAAFGQQLEAIAAAAVPEQGGMRVEIVGIFTEQGDVPPALDALLRLPAVDPEAWHSLPADTAITLVAKDASVFWPWLKEMFNLGSLEKVRDLVGLDLEADLVRADGPLTGEFALGISSPLPDQPISKGLSALQVLILAQDASEARAAAVQAAMEGRGAVFGPSEVEGVALQSQVGTELSGYAVSYGFDDDILLFGSSPGIIGQAIAAGREDSGLISDPTFQAIMGTWPDDPSFVVYLNSRSLIDLAHANMSAEQYQNSQEWRGFEVFEAIGLGLRLEPDRLEGAIYFFTE